MAKTLIELETIESHTINAISVLSFRIIVLLNDRTVFDNVALPLVNHSRSHGHSEVRKRVQCCP